MGNCFCGKLCYYEKSMIIFMILFRYNKTIEDEKDKKKTSGDERVAPAEDRRIKGKSLLIDNL